MKKFLITIITTLIVALSNVFMANSFCFYNDAGDSIAVRVYGDPYKSFDQGIDGGSNKCCNYGNTGCNPGGSKTNILGMLINTSCGCDYGGQIIAG